jgi:hypothetical protein
MRRTRRSLSRLWAAGLLTLAAIVPTGASGAKGVQVNIDYIDVERAPNFYVYVDYLNEADKPIRGLDPKDVTVLIDGEPWDDPVTVTPFAKSQEGVAFVLLVSTYRGFGTAFRPQKKGLEEFVRAMRPQDLAAIYTYAEGVSVAVDFTSDKDELSSGLRGIRPSDKPVNVWIDAVIAALEAFPADDPGFPRRRGIVMMADALDQNLADERGIRNRIKTDLAPKARALGVKFYSLGYTIESEKGLRIMKGVQKKFGGTFRRVRDSELQRTPSFFRDIVDRVHGEYIMQFRTSDLDHEETHSIQVNINHKGKSIESTPKEFTPPLVAGTPWWHYVLWVMVILLGLFLLIMLIKAIANRKPKQRDSDSEDEGRDCPMCEAFLPPGARTCEDCLSESHKARLTVVGGDWDGFIYPVVGENVTIGSREGEILVPIESVSGKHAGIRIDNMKFELSDHNSTNGTWVNGKRINKQFLRAGDAIRVGEVEMKFTLWDG